MKKFVLIKKVVFILTIIVSVFESYGQTQYYNTIDFNKRGESLNSDLSTLLNTSYKRLSDDASTNVLTIISSKVGNPDKVTVLFNELLIEKLNYGVNNALPTQLKDILKIGGISITEAERLTLGWNRHSVYPKNTSVPPLTITTGATDLFNLTASISYITSLRGNKAFGEGTGSFHELPNQKIYPEIGRAFV